MRMRAPHPAVMLYEHALLGEGIAKYLRSETGVQVMLAPVRDLEAVKAVLTLGPRVVIFERSEPLREIDLAKLAPHAVLIDVSTAVCRGPAVPRGAAGFERIIQAVRRASRRPSTGVGGLVAGETRVGEPDRPALRLRASLYRTYTA